MATMRHAGVVSMIACAAATGVHAQSERTDFTRDLMRSLDLAKIQRVSLLRMPAGNLKLAACIERLASDARLEAELAVVVVRNVPSEATARPILAFLKSPAGAKYADAVKRREPELKHTMGRRSVLMPGGVPMQFDEFEPGEITQIDAFFKTPESAPLLKLLGDTTGFAQLARNLALRRAMASECGIDVK